MIEFYFDFISPFGYFASLRVEDLARRHGRTVDWKPMLLGVTVMKIMQMKPLIQTPLKGPYIRREIARYLRLHKLQIKRPLGSPQMDPRSCARAFYWIKAHRPGTEAKLATALYHAHWAEGLDLAAPEAVADAAAGAGFDREEILAAIASEESRVLLRSNVEASIERGIFGSPTIVIDGEPFWGVQSMELAERWLAEGGW